MGQKQVDMWRSHGSVRALSYYAFASLAVSAIALSVDRERDCSVPVFEWLAAHIAALLFRVASALAILFGSRRAQLFERRRPLLGVLSRIADAACVLLCIVGLCYVFATAGGDCPDESPYSYRALALLASFEGFVALLAIFVGTCALAGGWAGARGLRVPGMGFHAVAQQMEAAAASRGATLQQISMLPLRRFVKSKAASTDKLVELESADPIVELEAPAKKKKTNNNNSNNSDTDSNDAKKNEEADSDDSEMEHSCAVCLGEYEPGELVRVLPCEHYFHRECIDTWVRRARGSSGGRKSNPAFLFLCSWCATRRVRSASTRSTPLRLCTRKWCTQRQLPKRHRLTQTSERKTKISLETWKEKQKQL
jgi:hypothetical protein